MQKSRAAELACGDLYFPVCLWCWGDGLFLASTAQFAVLCMYRICILVRLVFFRSDTFPVTNGSSAGERVFTSRKKYLCVSCKEGDLFTRVNISQGVDCVRHVVIECVSPISLVRSPTMFLQKSVLFLPFSVRFQRV